MSKRRKPSGWHFLFGAALALSLVDFPEAGGAAAGPDGDLAELEPEVREAIRGARIAVEAAPSSAESRGALGTICLAHGLSAAAAEAFAEAARLAPDDYRWPHLLGLALEEEQRLDEAANAYATAFARRPYYPSLLREARLRQRLGTLDAARERLALAAAHSPDDPAQLALAGEQAALDGRNEDAVRLLSRAVELAPAATRLHYPLAMAARATGDEATLRRHLALAGTVGIVPLDPLVDQIRAARVGATVWRLEAERAEGAGDLRAALGAYERALAARPDDVELAARVAATRAALAGGNRP